MKRRTLLTGSLAACSGVALGGVLLGRRERDDLVTVTGPTGEVVASAGVMNPQIRFGEDLMSRVSYVMMNPGGMGYP